AYPIPAVQQLLIDAFRQDRGGALRLEKFQQQAQRRRLLAQTKNPREELLGLLLLLAANRENRNLRHEAKSSLCVEKNSRSLGLAGNPYIIDPWRSSPPKRIFGGTPKDSTQRPPLHPPACSTAPGGPGGCSSGRSATRPSRSNSFVSSTFCLPSKIRPRSKPLSKSTSGNPHCPRPGLAP